jgi:predicted enzyme related to lactoylglutathione lyase
MNRVIHFELQADNIDRASKFYGNVLGWKFDKMMDKETGSMNYWGVTTAESGPGINGGLYSRKDGEDKFYLFDCTVQVENIDKTIEAIKANGGTITKEKSEVPHVGYFASAKDTEGNRFGLMQATEWQPK